LKNKYNTGSKAKRHGCLRLNLNPDCSNLPAVRRHALSPGADTQRPMNDCSLLFRSKRLHCQAFGYRQDQNPLLPSPKLGRYSSARLAPATLTACRKTLHLAPHLRQSLQVCRHRNLVRPRLPSTPSLRYESQCSALAATSFPGEMYLTDFQAHHSGLQLRRWSVMQICCRSVVMRCEVRLVHSVKHGVSCAWQNPSSRCARQGKSNDGGNNRRNSKKSGRARAMMTIADGRIERAKD